MKHCLVCLVLVASFLPGQGAVTHDVVSPDGRNRILFEAPEPRQVDGAWTFRIQRDGRSLMRGALGLEVQGGGDAFAGAAFRIEAKRSIDEIYHQPGHKSNPVVNRGEELALDLAGRGVWKSLRLEARAYDDGVAFRYVLPGQAGLDQVAITDEKTTLLAGGNPKAWPLYLGNFLTSHEDEYEVADWKDLRTEQLIGVPLLLEYPFAALAVTEAGLSNYAGLYWQGRRGRDGLSLASALAPRPPAGLVKVRSALPLATPWRVFMIADRAGSLVESSLVLNLNAPSALEDTSWLRFGKTTWNWWNGYFQQPVDFQTGANLDSIKYYIDFCAENGLAFHAIEAADANTSWYVQDTPGFAPGPGIDITKPRPELQFVEALAYAKSKGVGIRLWVHSQALAPRLEEAFAQYGAWGIDGLMVDFLDRDDQEMVQWSERVLQVAAQHHLRIQFHGVWQPTGRRRTYPNLVNHEAVLNLEYLKWSDRCDPEHNVITPYTRMLAGPMDYHLGGFQSVPRDRFAPRNVQPQVLGTRCHHLAMYVVYENPVPMVADGASAYVNQAGFEFIKQVPTVWEETRFVAGEVGDSIVVARRHGQDWYVGAMTDWTAREINLPLTFLGETPYRAAIWRDDDENEDPNQLVQSTRTVASSDQLTLNLASGGGQVIWLTPEP